MKKIEHYCSAVDQIKHEPKKIEEVLAMKQEKKQIKMTKGGKAFGAVVAAALVCANIAGGYWLLNGNKGLTEPAASAPAASAPAAMELVTSAPVSTQEQAKTAVAWSQEKPKAGLIFDRLTADTLNALSTQLDDDVSAEDKAEMLNTLQYYAGSMVLKKDGAVLSDKETAIAPEAPIPDMNGFSLELHPNAAPAVLANCELSVYAFLYVTEDGSQNFEQLKQKQTAGCEQRMLTDGSELVLPLEMSAGYQWADAENTYLKIDVNYRPRVCENEADEVEFRQEYMFKLTPDSGYDYESSKPDETNPLIEYANDNCEEEQVKLPEGYKPQNRVMMLAMDGGWVAELDAEAATFSEYTAKQGEIMCYYAADSALMQDGKELTGYYDRVNDGEKQKLTSLDGLTFEIRPDAAKEIPGECELQIEAFLEPADDVQEEQVKNPAGELTTKVKLDSSNPVSVPVQLDFGKLQKLKVENDTDANGWVLRLEVTFHPLTEDAATMDIGRQYAFELNLK